MARQIVGEAQAKWTAADHAITLWKVLYREVGGRWNLLRMKSGRHAIPSERAAMACEARIHELGLEAKAGRL
ncbi:MAG: hypothetical protein IPM06_18685 [Rhizobiales bacterium]|nr:hypothetical protein [Hyphomicrobiales bacterium]